MTTTSNAFFWVAMVSSILTGIATAANIVAE
jgi:hypothetical protein